MLYWKAFHIISMVTWFSGLFYLPRLFVYHAMADDSIGIDRFKVMERKLYYGITWPSGIATTVCGLALLYHEPSHLLLGWVQLKLSLAALLWVYHLSCGYYLKKFARDEAPYTHIFYRWYNEVPVFFLISIILLVIIQPHL